MTRLWPLVLSTVALGINSYVIAGILPSIAVSLRTSQGAVGLGVTAFTAAYALTAPWLPGLLTRTGTTRRALSTALTVFTAGSAITALSPSPRVFLVARAVAGVGAGALTALATGAAGAMAWVDPWVGHTIRANSNPFPRMRPACRRGRRRKARRERSLVSGVTQEARRPLVGRCRGIAPITPTRIRRSVTARRCPRRRRLVSASRRMSAPNTRGVMRSRKPILRRSPSLNLSRSISAAGTSRCGITRRPTSLIGSPMMTTRAKESTVNGTRVRTG